MSFLKPDELEVELVAAADDAEFRSDAYQHEIQQVVDTFKNRGLEVRPLWSLQKSFPGGSWLTGDLLLSLVKVVVPAFGGVLVGWLQGRAGRKVRVKFGDTEVEASTPEDVRRILELVEEHKAKTQGDAGAAA